jgi:hypothetical protein
MNNKRPANNLERQNGVTIGLLARLVWTPERLVDIVTGGKRNPKAYRRVYNALDGVRTAQSLASMAGVTPRAISYVLRAWEEEGIVTNEGTAAQPRYRAMMHLPKKGKRGRQRTNGE